MTRLPRRLHPLAWWLWAIGLATAAGRTTDPLLLALVLAGLGTVVAARRSQAPWARGYRSYLMLALTVIAVRVTLRAVFSSGAAAGDHVVFTLPRVPVPQWYAGISIGGPVCLESVLTAAADGLRLACLLCCLGAANVLADPKRALRVLPGALHELGVAVTVALTVAPQLVESAQRVRRATRLRGDAPRGVRALRRIAVPVLHDALDRSLRLAAGMDARGYGRTGTATGRSRALTGALVIGGLGALCVGAYGLLDPTVPVAVGGVAFAGGATACAGALALGGRRVSRTRYRPDPWRREEWTAVGGGALAAAASLAGPGVRPGDLTWPGEVLGWPALPLAPTLGVLLAVLAGLAAPVPASAAPTALAPTRPAVEVTA